MTCTHFASFAQGPVRASWLVADIRPGPRSPRILSRSGDRSGAVPITSPNWMPDGLQATDLQRAFHGKHLLALKDALTETVAKLRREHKSTCLAMAHLKAVTHELLAMGER